MAKRTADEILNARCPDCKKMNAIGYGTRNGKQRFKCKDCSRIFTKTSTNNRYTSREKRLLALFLNFLEKDFKSDEDFNEILKDLEVDNFKLKNIKVRTIQATSDEVDCYNPKLLICKSGANLVLTKIPETPKEKNKWGIEKREIKLVDSSATGHDWDIIL